jgi:ACS family tartrate transporter-like MFS transporter
MTNSALPTAPVLSPLDRARKKAYWRLLPLLFLCYVIAYVDRANVSLAKLTMAKDMPAFTDDVIGFGAGIFFLGYFLLEIPGSLIVEKWGARRWICRIMLTWGVMAACTAAVSTPNQFYLVRFLLGLAEAGFFPGVIVYLTHWFTGRDRSRALAMFMIATPSAQILSPKITNLMLPIGTTEVVNGVTVQHPLVFGLSGWQLTYIAWGVPAVVLGVIVWFMLTDRPAQAKWLKADERDALEAELESERQKRAAGKRLTAFEAMRHPKVLLLALAYFGCTTANYGVEFFLPSILQNWYNLKLNSITWLVILPPILALFAQLFVGWNSDRTKERRFHAVVPIIIGATALAIAPLTQGNLPLTIGCFVIAAAGIKAYQPAFWALPSMFLTSAAAAGSIGLINSVGNLGGFLGPRVLGYVKTNTGSFAGGVYCLAGAMMVTATIIFFLGLGRKEQAE